MNKWVSIAYHLDAFKLMIPQRPRERAVLRNFPVAVLMWRMSIVQELVLSGFQLELYAPDERPFAYWYTAQIIEQHISCLDGISSVLSPGQILIQYTRSGPYTDLLKTRPVEKK